MTLHAVKSVTVTSAVLLLYFCFTTSILASRSVVTGARLFTLKLS